MMAQNENSGSREGRGLSGLLARLNLGRASQSPGVVPLSDIIPDPNQPRKNFAPAQMAELAESIKLHGLLQPLVVTPSEEGGKYRLIAGERRFHACKAAGLTEVPVRVVRGNERTLLQLQLIENLQREDLTVLETAAALRDMVERHAMTQGELASAIGWTRTAVSNKIRLLSLPKEVISLLEEGKLTEGHARVLLPIASPAKIVVLARDCVKNGWSVKALAAHVERGTLRKTVLLRSAYKPWRPKGVTKIEKRLGIKIGAAGDGKTNRVLLRGLTDLQVERLLRILERSADVLNPTAKKARKNPEDARS